jgi:anti-sigma regulatory factor (Ser/Thr protein kinase)
VRRTRSFSHDPASVAAARRFATQALTAATREVRDAVELMVSELATNCIRHGGCPFDLTVVQAPDVIRVEVTDRDDGTPSLRSPSPDEPTGRGLQIVSLLSEAWGVDLLPASGKTVWFTITPRRIPPG